MSRSTRKLERARRKAAKAAQRLAAIETKSKDAIDESRGWVLRALADEPAPTVGHGAPGPSTRFEAKPPPFSPTQPTAVTPGRSHRGRRALLAVGVLAAVAGAGAGVYFGFLRDRMADDAAAPLGTVELTDVSGIGAAAVVRDGALSADALATQLASSGKATLDGGVVTLSTSVVIEKTGRLDVHDVELRLSSDATGTALIEVRGGSLDVARATITSWDKAANGPDREIKDGRSSVLVTDAGTADVEDSKLVALGYEEVERHGFTLSGGSTSGTVSRSEFSGGQSGVTVSGNVHVDIDGVEVHNTSFAGIELAGTTGVKVVDSVVRDSAADGIVVRGASSGVTLRGNDVFGNGGIGLSLAGSSGKVVVDNNLSHRNGRSGITISNTRDARVSGNRVWSNVVGVSLVGGNSGTVIDGNKIGGNQGAGIESSSAGNTALVHDNVVDHNEHGVVVSDGTIEIRGNRIEDNTLGVAVLDKSPRVIIRDNTIRNSADGGIRLVSVKDVVVEGNSITNNRMAAFIVDHANDSQSFQATNRYDSGRKGAEWVYEPLRSAAELADLTPVPSEFFTQPNVEFLLPAEQGGVR